MAGPWLGLLVAGVPPLSPVVDPGPFRVYSVGDKLALRMIFPLVLRYSPVSIIPVTLPSRHQPNRTYRNQAGEGCLPRNKEIATILLLQTDAYNYKIIGILKQLEFRLSLRHVSVHAGTIFRELSRA